MDTFEIDPNGSPVIVVGFEAETANTEKGDE